MDCDQAATTASTSWHESKRSPCSFRTLEEIRLPRPDPVFHKEKRHRLSIQRRYSIASLNTVEEKFKESWYLQKRSVG